MTSGAMLYMGMGCGKSKVTVDLIINLFIKFKKFEV